MLVSLEKRSPVQKYRQNSFQIMAVHVFSSICSGLAV